jgi:hypothetical protein
VLAYDLKTRVSGDVAVPFKGVRHAASVVHRNVIYVIGGNTSVDYGESDLIQAFALSASAEK